jgi:hypothetical protein
MTRGLAPRSTTYLCIDSKGWMGQHAQMADPKHCTVKFKLKGYKHTTTEGGVPVEDVAYFLDISPDNQDGFDGDAFSFNLPYGISDDKAAEIRDYLQRNVRSVSYTKFGPEDRAPRGERGKAS